VVAIANEFVQDCRYECECFGMVQFDTASETSLGEEAGLGKEEFVDLQLPVSIVFVRVLYSLTSLGAKCILKPVRVALELAWKPLSNRINTNTKKCLEALFKPLIRACLVVKLKSGGVLEPLMRGRGRSEAGWKESTWYTSNLCISTR
jgi:hypothetical protein